MTHAKLCTKSPSVSSISYCHGCFSAQHHHSQCACVKNSLSCRNCRKGNDCRNPFSSNYKDESRKVEVLEKRKQKPDDSAKESSSRKAPETIRDVKGDGNCFFRCISVFFNGDEDKPEDIRRNVVETFGGEQRSLQASGGWGLRHTHPEHVKSNRKQKFLGNRSRTVCNK